MTYAATLAVKALDATPSFTEIGRFAREFFKATPAYLVWEALRELRAERRAAR